MIFRRALGRHKEHDPASRSYRIVRAPLPPTKSVRWTHYGPILDQTDLGACTCFATYQLLSCDPFYSLLKHRFHPRKDGGLFTDADAITLYEKATRLDAIPGHYPPDDTGSSGLAAMKAAKKMGLIASYHHAFGIAEALAAIALAPVTTGVNWYEGFDTPVGKDAELQISGRIRGGHEVTISEIDVPNRRVRGMSSWGPSFGDGGFFTMTWETWKRLLEEDGDVTSAKL